METDEWTVERTNGFTGNTAAIWRRLSGASVDIVPAARGSGWEDDRERRPLVHACTIGFDATAMRFDKAPDDRQPHAEASVRPPEGGVGLGEWFEQLRPEAG
jgi:hypothetical protein